MEEELINKKDIKKKKNILTLSILSTIIILLGSAYAFFTYFKSAEAFTLTSNSITASFTEGTNQIDFTNAYPISDEFALENLSKLDYIDFTVSGNAINSKEAITYEIFLTEANGNTLSNNFVKLYLTDGNNNEVVSPNIYGNLGTTTYTSEPTGKVILTKTLSGKFSKNYRLYCWLDSTFEDNTISRNFSFYVNLYAYNNTSTNASQEITINTIEDLVNLSNAVNSGTTYQGVTVNLERSLDFEDTNSYEDSTRTDYGDINGNGTVETLISELTNDCETCGGFIPIGKDTTNSFQGTFDGNNYRIDNLYENNVNETSNRPLGLFGTIKNSSINNLIISGEIKINVIANAGGVAGTNYGNSTINNCHSEVNITSNFPNYSVGGVVGTTESSSVLTINNSSNIGNVSGSNNAGGIVGYSNGTLTIQNSYNTGKVSNNVGNYVGGLLGRDNATTNSTIITDSNNNGLIKMDYNGIGSNKFLGGLVGEIHGRSSINNSNNLNNVIITGNSTNKSINIGGLIGLLENSNSTTINNNYNTGMIKFDISTVSATQKIGGLIGMINGANLMMNNSYNTGNVISTTLSSSVLLYVGGIVGQSWSNGIRTIENTYNLGNVTGGNRTGGIVGQAATEGTITLNKVYNGATIISEMDSTNQNVICSGLIGYYIDSVKVNILNSYNSGSVSGATTISGLARSSTGGTTNIINSYNVGDITSSGVIASGIISSNATDYINNVYNLGDVEATTNKAGIAVAEQNTFTIDNAYYVNTNATGVAVKTSFNTFTTPMSLNDMKSQTFVNTLNSNVSNINLNNIDSSLANYSLSRWKLGTDGYPVFEWQN